MSKVIEFNIPIDDDGFISLQCPFCKVLFKISADDFKADDVYQLYCPYCGLVSEDGFHTEDIKEHVLDLAKNEANSMINQFSKDLEKMFKGNNFVSFKAGTTLPIKKPKTLIEPMDMQEIMVKCCDKKVKVQYQVNGVYCPFCGVK